MENGVFVTVAGGAAPAVTTAASSTDGVTWTIRTLPTAANWQSITYGNGVFVATAFNSTTAASSTDGITWATRTLPLSANWYGVAATNFYNPVTGTLDSPAPNQYITSANYYVGPYEKNLIYRVGAGTATITLPNPGAYPGRELTIVYNVTGTGSLVSSVSNVQPLTSTTPGTTICSNTGPKYARLVSNGQNWVIMEAI
jgi:hypothetical protein